MVTDTFLHKGHDAVLTLKTGERFTGVFSGGSLEPNVKQHQYILKMVKRLPHTASQQARQGNGTGDSGDEFIGDGEDFTMVFDKDDTADLAVSNAQIYQNLSNGMCW